MVSSIIIKGRSELRQLALGNSDRKQFASKIKQYKRFVINEKVDVEQYYLPYMIPLLEQLSKGGELIFSIDGSTVGKGCICLMFSVIYKGKAIPVVWQVYKGKKGHLPENHHQAILKDLSKIVPKDCKVTVVGDGEFDGCDWQSDILKLGWNYVLKTGKSQMIEEDDWDEFKLGNVQIERGTDLFFESIKYTSKKWVTNLLIWHGKEHKNPIYLLTNLDFKYDIKRLYKKRFLIEPFFRDQKSNGFHIQKSGLRDPKRLKRLLIATCLAYVLSIMAGTKATQSKFYNEIARTDGQFLSLFTLGYRYIEFLVDNRQWRAFSWKKDLYVEPDIINIFLDDQLICVPF